MENDKKVSAIVENACKAKTKDGVLSRLRKAWRKNKEDEDCGLTLFVLLKHAETWKICADYGVSLSKHPQTYVHTRDELPSFTETCFSASLRNYEERCKTETFLVEDEEFFKVLRNRIKP